MHVYLRGVATTTGTSTTYTGAAPIRMLTFAEHNLILAEHYQRTGNVASATTALRAGIQASMDAAGVAAADATAYIAAIAAQVTSANLLRTIIEEKFVANYGVAVEPWTDWRRTGFPALSLAANAVLQQIPRILPYSDLERVANPANTPERTDLTAPSVFWDPGR